MENKSILLSTAYFAPIQYYCKLVQYQDVLIEKFENYSKQSYRNRCNIYGANGLLSLSVPIEKASKKKILTKDVRITYDTNWQKLHWKGIESAYKSSPYYEYYIDDIQRFFHKKWDYLLDFNMEIQEELLNILEITPNLSLSEDYIESLPEGMLDLRDGIHPKKSKNMDDPHFDAEAYTQVFSDRHGFLPNLSILDAIFNLGPEAISYLEGCVKE
ncbi:MAG: WbqC family protein [Marinifilaceae bacterium]